MKYRHVYNLFRKIFNKEYYPASLTFWYPRREDVLAFLIITLLPLLIALLQLSGWLKADPMLYLGGIAKGYQGGFLPGQPYIDPNNGYTTQALGYRKDRTLEIIEEYVGKFSRCCFENFK